MGDWYVWIKVLHILAIMSWMAGLLYLPRLFVYHCEAPVNSVQNDTFKIMERRLFQFIMSPAMIVAWSSGLILAFTGGHISEKWFIAKLVAVICLTGSHFFMGGALKLFMANKNERPAKFYRILNEVPTLLMVAIVIFVIVKPF